MIGGVLRPREINLGRSTQLTMSELELLRYTNSKKLSLTRPESESRFASPTVQLTSKSVIVRVLSLAHLASPTSVVLLRVRSSLSLLPSSDLHRLQAAHVVTCNLLVDRASVLISFF